MKKKDTDEVLEEVIKNVRSDRKVLEDFILRLNPSSFGSDPLLAAAITENLTKFVDSLTRNNSQLVEVAKIKLKQQILSAREEGISSPSDVKEMYDDIGELDQRGSN